MSDRNLLPPNATPQEIALAGAVARISDVPVPNRDLYNPALCPAALLPWLAWTFSLDNWDPLWTEAQKRQTIAQSIQVHRHKGTIGAVRGALAAVGVGARLQEWFNQTPAGAPYTYRLLLEVDQVGIDQAGMVTVVDVVNSTKNLRSHLDNIGLSVKSKAGPNVGGVSLVGNEITVLFGGGGLISDGFVISDGAYKANGIKLG